ncbi:MAG: hypothetical protein ACRD68_08160 [Pyrinomonadaceae bacterium]
MNHLTQRVVTIDIETLPALNPSVSETEARKRGDDAHARTALNGDFGRILCIGYIDEVANGRMERGVVGWDEAHERFTCDERATLAEFWTRLRGFRPGVDRVDATYLPTYDVR